jgi:hypothetical protein
MENEFIPYIEALELKELGFDESCFAIYDKKILKSLGAMQRKNSTYPDIITAPLYQQAFRWFREKYNMVGQVNVCTYFIYDMSNNDGFHTTLKMIKQYDRLCNNYEESEFECLKKLIEIIQTNS